MERLFDPAVWKRHALLTCAEMRRAESLTVAQGKLSFFDLMLKAGQAIAKDVMNRFEPCRVLVLCGLGNNSGDGYVAAETLRQAGWTVRVGRLGEPKTPDAQQAASQWQGEVLPLGVSLLDEADLIIDALFGTGLIRPLEGAVLSFIEDVAARKIPVIAADFASGVAGDTGAVLGAAFQAQVTVTFFRKKRGHVLMPGLAQGGEVIVVDTGVCEDVLEEMDILTAENNEKLWRDSFPAPKAQGHKYHRGHALIFGGSLMTGASRLAARAAQRMGAGLVSLAAPRDVWELYARALESVIVPCVEDRAAAQALMNDPKKNAILIGPGLGLEPEKKDLVLDVLASQKPTVLDADVFALFADDPEVLFQAIHEACVLTPHEGEFKRLFGFWIDPQADKITRAQKAAKLADATVLIKGADTVMASPNGQTVVNHNAPPWLATAGAGDVLSGMILGLITSGMPPFAAACAAAFIHGEMAVAHGPGLIAEDLVEGISRALAQKIR